MNKKFYFALALTAGLFASCSSDDLTAEAPGANLEINDGEAAPITINVDQPTKYTRGTGGVGDAWGGQKFNLFMFKKGTFEPATYDVAGTPTPYYNNTEMTTESGTTIAHEVLTGDVINYQYFPATGRFDFWAYRIDDAWTDGSGTAGWDGGDATAKVINGTATVGATTYTWAAYTGTGSATLSGAGAPTTSTVGAVGDIYQNTGDGSLYECTAVTAGTTTDTETAVTVPFIINGSQDLMIAETKTADAADALVAASSITAEDAPSYIYSAYAARRGVNPEMTFKHQLTRLQFKVKAHDRDVSTQATPKLDPATPGYYAGFKVKKVEVWSKNKGEMVVAYKGTAPTDRIVWDGSQSWVARDADDAWLGTTTLVPFELKSRNSSWEDADIKWIQVGEEATAASTALLATIPENYALVTETFNDDAVCYTSNAVNEHKEPLEANKTTFGVVRGNATAGESVYVIAVKTGDHGDESHTSWAKAIEKADVVSQLVDLVPVIPQWEGYSNAEGWLELADKDTYNWELIASPTDAQKTAAVNADAVPGTTTPGTDGDIKHVVVNFVDRYYILNGITRFQNPGTAAAAGFDPTSDPGTVGDIVYVADANGLRTYYEYKAAGIVREGNAVATPIGESMLVAPADENGYLIRFTYERCIVLTSNNDFETREATAIINVKVKDEANAGTAYAGKFAPGKKYTVTAILYPDGEIKYENGDIEAETDGTGDLDDDGNGYGMEN